MASKPTGAAAPFHAPFGRDSFFGIRLRHDPDQAYANVVRILATQGHHPDDALAACSPWVDGFGVELIDLADGSTLRYVNVGDTYKATLCHVDGRGYFVSSWGDVVEAADRSRADAWGDRRCASCSEWATDKGEPCGNCGRDPETGEPWPEQLRFVRLETGHTLRTWDTGRTSGRGMMARTRIGYELCDHLGRRIFRGVDFGPSPTHADDADATLRALCGFLFLRPGDTDRDHFEHYSPQQLAFARSTECELLAYLYGEEGPGEFADVVEGGAA